MTDFSFFTTLQVGLLNAWIPSFGIVLIQFIYLAVFKEGGKRAVDTSWYTGKDKMNASVSTILQIATLVLSVFVPFKFGTAWFLAGTVIYCFHWASLSGLFTAMQPLQQERPFKEGFIVGRVIRCTFSSLQGCSVFV